MAASINWIWQIGIFFILVASLYEFFENKDPNGCEMTYMFATPEYIVSDLYPCVFPRQILGTDVRKTVNNSTQL